MPTKASLCIVDDSADYRSLLEFIFKRHLTKYSVSFYANGRIFLDKLAGMSILPRLIVLDRQMPTLDGYQTLLALKQHSAYMNIPVVMMSNEVSTKETKRCYRAGANAYLVKPINVDELTETMLSICTYWLENNRDPLNVN